MTAYSRSDVVLVNFVFPDQIGTRRRPALVISSETYLQGRQEVVIAAITSNIQRILPGDSVLKDWGAAGLLFPSVVTGILRTIEERSIYRRLGAMLDEDLRSVEASLRLSLGL